MSARWPPGWGVPTRQAGGWPGPVMRLAKQPRPSSPSVVRYVQQAQTQIGGYGVGQALVAAGGGATVTLGPSGLGTLWYPQQAVLSTTSGLNDSSTAIAYLGPPTTVPASLIFQSEQAGADVQGIAVPVLQPGDLITIVWSGGNPGDLATVRILGALTALTPA